MVFLIFSRLLAILGSMFKKDEMNNYDHDDYSYNFNPFSGHDEHCYH
jgi:hypothetical protein